MILNDKDIRPELKKFLLSRVPAPRRLLDELHISNGNAIADVVGIYQHTHCFEIKGQNDSLIRIERQARFYNTCFRRITLVTTANHIAKAHMIIPAFWGLIVAEPKSAQIRFKYVRCAKSNPCFNRNEALMVLWKEELADIARRKGGFKKSYNRMKLAATIAEFTPDSVIQEEIASILLRRNKGVDG